MSQLPDTQKLAAVREIIYKSKPLSVVSKKYKCSRQTLYAWVKRYKASNSKGSQVFSSKYRKGKKHHRSLSWRIERAVLDLVVKNPSFSLRKLTLEINNLGYKISLKGVYGVLSRHNLTSSKQRHDFSLTHPVQTLFSHTFSPAYRAKAVEEYLKDKQSISDICRRWNISRPTFYKWLVRYNGASATGLDVVESLVRRHKRGKDHHRSVSSEAERVVLRLASEKPEYSVHKLHTEVPRVEGKPIVGHHGIQNILQRNNLGTYNQRLAYAEGTVGPAPIPTPVEAPALPRGALIRILSPFATIPKFASNPITWPITIPFALFVLYIFEVDKVFRPSVFFPITALTFGLLFFAYSAKYYASLVVVLRQGAKHGREDSNEQDFAEQQTSVQQTDSSRASFNIKNLGSTALRKLTGGFRDKNHVGLVEDLSKVELKFKPFVSVHVPIYNEKRVVERMIKANSSLKWQQANGEANYELIVVDDSNDETTDIAKKVMSEEGRTLVLEKADEKLHIFSSIPPKGSGKPVIKLIHRNSRQGYKGAALAKALENTTRQAEYILIFDADFIPYPDTVEQFVKYFALVNERSEEKDRVAAIQGYQWHVLNKSENWITRGVRSEYAGSYVVERSAIELYGGLKMIAGSVYAIRRDILQKFGWGTSITEDFELTMRLYAQGYKVIYTPYIQAPAEAVATIKRLIRQRMRWAEGHSFNIKKYLKDIVKSPHLSFSEKVEFAFLGPYYLQAAFFMVGTFAWFIAEVIIGVSLPFWTAALGWSLVFSNFLALPIVNLLGLFLEQSEEKDYLGVFSFILLSYLVTPFQAYAAIKGYFEKEEGPWFRTPKTGHVTDVLGRFKIWHWKSGLPFGKGAQTLETGETPAFSPALASSFNPLQGHEIKPRRVSWASRSVIAVFLVIIMFANYLAYFAEPKPAKAAGTPKIEQVIEIMNQEFQNSSSTYSPTDNGLGLIEWDSNLYSDISAVYFEVVMDEFNSANTIVASLFDKDGGQITQSEISSSSASYTRYRDATDLKGILVDNTHYTVRVKRTAGTGSGDYIQAARLIIEQVGTEDGSITKTATYIDIGYDDTRAANTFAFGDNEDPKMWLYTASAWDPTPTFTLEATLKTSAGTAHVALNNTNGTTDTTSSCNTQSATTTTTSTSFVLVEVSFSEPTDTDRHCVLIKNSATNTTSIANARIRIEQNDSEGILALELQKEIYNRGVSHSTATFTNKHFMTRYDPSTLSGTDNIYYEMVGEGNNCGGKGGCDAAVESRLEDFTTPDVINNATDSTLNVNALFTRKRSGELSANTDWPSSAKDMDSEMRSDTSAKSVEASQTAFYIQLSSIPVPEIAIVALPAMLFLPRIIKWFKQQRKRKKRKAGGKGKPNKISWDGWIVNMQPKLAI